MPRELRIPEGAVEGAEAENALELMRVWWIGTRPEFVLRPALKDPRNIGRMLGEAAYHYAQVHAAHGDGDAADLLEQIRAGFDDSKSVQMTTVMAKAPAKEG